ncbi:putative glycosyltransferase AER61 [Gossypium arboreum]|uniref:Putative glycosyltransferase AER61 n=1 Tax=Gossypium arboreum TaxID=29729 RepID=A0A0B0N154_GOSAR|nr:putative glycosyltransferase AER61 [Gossypium arboreum]
MESEPKPGKEQDLGLNRTNCPYFVPRPCLGHGIGIDMSTSCKTIVGLSASMCVILLSLSIPSGSMGSLKICQRNDESITKLAWGSKDIGGSLTLSIGSFGYC